MLYFHCIFFLSYLSNLFSLPCNRFIQFKISNLWSNFKFIHFWLYKHFIHWILLSFHLPKIMWHAVTSNLNPKDFPYSHITNYTPFFALISFFFNASDHIPLLSDLAFNLIPLLSDLARYNLYSGKSLYSCVQPYSTPFIAGLLHKKLIFLYNITSSLPACL
jgi:hypothetical protein